ncbi:MAG: peptide ABC transporter substrate-binding protein [SAR86 cluster bacterium]|jgi:oligopeptide transport system substrate-binding protein|uniref:Peptide ABC transporter substrate-binding protein n=1 Tax=SAR86 cluster bacterium TaxID=2030880 RepID=A0A520N4D7_9GAMM|nr:MAG: peptide ABC transporter substrate-binding protein [SAR86 cluster bacterium]|tara:strand:+ start:6160 stop:7779 length:1620 start_codon:yes stop_codon:yes gene_type:complete
MTKKINILSITLIFLIGCSENISPVDSGLEQQIYHHGNGSEPQGIDPHIVTGVPEHHILISLCEGLTIPNPNPTGSDGYIPGTAESWTVSDDGKEYIFKLNKNAKWSNGDPVTADDFVWSWKRILTASLGSQYPDMLYYLVGAYEYHNGEIDNFDEVGVKALDSQTLKVNLKNPTPFFIGLLSHYSTWPVHKETVLKHGDIDDRNGEWTRPGNFVCNGPFQLKTWELNNRIVVEKNPHYYDASMVRLNEIHYYPVSNVMTEDRMFRAGQLHLTSSMPTQKCPIYIEEKNPNLKIDPYMGTYFYRINTENETLSDVRVRKALAYSIDRQLLVDKVTQCGQIPAYSFTPPGSNGYQPSTEIPYDPVLAKQLLAEAGYSSDKPFPKLEILFNTNEGHRKVALAIQQMWQNELGIEVELVNQDWKVYLSREMVGDFQISRAGWIGDYEDPNTFLDLMRPNRGNNKTGWENMDFDALVEEANTINNQDKRYELLNEAEKILIDNMPIIPLYTYVRVYQLSPDVKGFNPHILDHHHPKFIYLERD